MIFEHLTLENFGIYKGIHEVDLDSPEHEKPIILFGALNGAGKTTFLDALQLVLYGKHAKCSNRGKLSYSAYLEQTINRYAQENKASITLRFRHDTSGRRHTYEINRAWSKEDKKGCKETVVVSHNGHPDALLSDHWDEFINEFIPQSLSELFFFDGEKIENLADPAHSAELVKTGIEALLGLDLLAQLNVDLGVLKKRKQDSLLDDKQHDKLLEAEEYLIQLKLSQEKINDEISSSLEALEDMQAEVHYQQQKLKDSGAHLLESKDAFTREEATIKTKINECNANLIKLASGALPFKLVRDLMDKTITQLKKEKEIKEYQAARALLLEQENKIFQYLDEQNASSTLLSQLKIKLAEEREEADSRYNQPCHLNSDLVIFNGLDVRIAKDEKEVKETLDKKKKLQNDLEFFQRKLSTIPDIESVQDMIESSLKSEQNIRIHEEKHVELINSAKKLESDIKQAEEKLNSIRIQGNASNFEQKRQQQLAKHMEKLQYIITDFKNDLIKENIERLQRKVKAKFDTIKRKDSLVSKIVIDPESFVITLLAQDRKPISPSRLSAGERQLLAISVLWGLADESGKELPTIIDTPMGRLDGKHRTRLIEEYFPMAASQVILLSTDEEIQGNYYKKLKPYISKEYHINYQESEQTSTIKAGYFPENG